MGSCRLILHLNCFHHYAPHRWTLGLQTYEHRRQNFKTCPMVSIHLWEVLVFSWALFLLSLSCSEEKWSQSEVASCSFMGFVWFSFSFSWTLDSKQEVLVCHWYFPLDLWCYNTKLWKPCSNFRLICSYICWLISLHY